MGYDALESCPVVYRCCGRVPLRPACAFIGALGLLPAALLLFLYTSAGAAAAAIWGVPALAASAMCYACLILGVLFCAIHVVLLIATVFRSETLCQLYFWSMLGILVALFLCAVALAVTAALADAGAVFVTVTLLIVIAYTVLSLYFMIVVANFRMTLP